MEIMLSLTMKGTAWVWIAHYIRDLLRKNGVVSRAELESERLLKEDEFNYVRHCFCKRLNDSELNLLFEREGELGGFV